MTCNKGEGKILKEGDIPRKSVSWRANFRKYRPPEGDGYGGTDFLGHRFLMAKIHIILTPAKPVGDPLVQQTRT